MYGLIWVLSPPFFRCRVVCLLLIQSSPGGQCTCLSWNSSAWTLFCALSLQNILIWFLSFRCDSCLFSSPVLPLPLNRTNRCSHVQSSRKISEFDLQHGKTCIQLSIPRNLQGIEMVYKETTNHIRSSMEANQVYRLIPGSQINGGSIPNPVVSSHCAPLHETWWIMRARFEVPCPLPEPLCPLIFHFLPVLRNQPVAHAPLIVLTNGCDVHMSWLDAVWSFSTSMGNQESRIPHRIHPVFQSKDNCIRSLESGRSNRDWLEFNAVTRHNARLFMVMPPHFSPNLIRRGLEQLHSLQ